MLYETAIAAEVFGVDRSDLSPTGQWYDLRVYTPDGSSCPWLPGFPASGFAELAEVDTVVVPSTSVLDGQPDPALSAALRAAHDAGARIAALCTGAFVLAGAGLLDGRTAATHWMHAQELARLHPHVNVRSDVLYVDDGQVLTSAGKTAALCTRRSGSVRWDGYTTSASPERKTSSSAPKPQSSKSRCGAAWARPPCCDGISIEP